MGLWGLRVCVGFVWGLRVVGLYYDVFVWIIGEGV